MASDVAKAGLLALGLMIISPQGRKQLESFFDELNLAWERAAPASAWGNNSAQCLGFWYYLLRRIRSVPFGTLLCRFVRGHSEALVARVAVEPYLSFLDALLVGHAPEPRRVRLFQGFGAI